MYFTIYKITNKINGKIYIGKHQTKDLSDGYMGSGTAINRAYQKYGIENFVKEILYVFSNQIEMDLKEKELVSEDFCLSKDTYNINIGGNGGFSYINSIRDHHAHNLKIAKSRSYKEEKLLYYLHNKHNIVIKKLHAQGKYNNSFSKSAVLNAQSESAKLKRKETLKSIGHSKGIKNSQFGSIWITNGVQSKKIKNIDDIPNGWRKGRVMNRNTE